MKSVIAITVIFGSIAASAARAQVEPQATSPGSIGISGTLTYSARFSQITEFYGGQSGAMANLSGTLGYISTSQGHPTEINFTGGDSWRLAGIGFSNGPYESLGLSQVFNRHHWSLEMRDQVGYHHGVGINEPNPNSANSAAEPILTLDTSVLDNDALVRLSDKLSGSTTLNASAGYNQLDFLNGTGRDTNALLISGGLDHRFEGRDTVFAEESFVQYRYSGGASAQSVQDLQIDASTTMVGWSRLWNRRISTSVAAGPQWVTFQSSTPLPSVTGYSVSASASDAFRFGTADVAFRHGINGGGGYFNGAEVDDARGTFTREFGHVEGRKLTVRLLGGYRRTNTLGSSYQLGGLQGTFAATYSSAQVTRQLGRHFSAYAGYMATNQSSTSMTTNGPLYGLWQTISFGLGFTPPPIHFRH